MLKISIGIFVSLSLFLGSCEANTPPSYKNSDNLQTEQTEPLKNEVLTQSIKKKSFTPLRIGKKVTEISPYVMSSYGFKKLIGAEHFQISLFAAHSEDMIYEGEIPIVAIMFVLKGDLHEIPLAFHVYGDLDPEFSDTLNFCVFDDNIENKLTVYASYSCKLEHAPSTGAITLEFNLGENSLAIDGREKHQLN